MAASSIFGPFDAEGVLVHPDKHVAAGGATSSGKNVFVMMELMDLNDAGSDDPASGTTDSNSDAATPAAVFVDTNTGSATKSSCDADTPTPAAVNTAAGHLTVTASATLSACSLYPSPPPSPLPCPAASPSSCSSGGTADADAALVAAALERTGAAAVGVAEYLRAALPFVPARLWAGRIVAVLLARRRDVEWAEAVEARIRREGLAVAAAGEGGGGDALRAY